MGPEPLHTYGLEGEADPACLQRIHELLDRLWAAEPGVSVEDRDMFATAVAEVAGNIVQHSAGTERVRLNLQLRVYPDRVEASLTDGGSPADIDLESASFPDEPFAESGRGLALARAAVDELHYERDGSANRWRVVRRRAS